MIKKLTLTAVLVAAIFPASLYAGGSSTQCATRYPVVLAHGMGAQATISLLGVNILDYWWGIEDALEDEGADVYITTVNGMDTTLNKALEFRRQLLYLLTITGKSKVNIIGHSHGTVYTRLAISNYGLASRIASHTSISGPHRGSSVADFILNLIPRGSWSLVGDALDWVYAFVFGDVNPNSLQNGIEVTRGYMQNVFNPNCPNAAGVYYQSWASKIRYMSNSLVLEIPWLICKYYEGDNDGLVSVASAKWGNFRGVIEGAWWSGGVDHLNIVGQPLGITPGFDAQDFFIDIVSDLKNRRY